MEWKLTDTYFSLEFDERVRALSSAIYGGGYRNISSFLNMRVDQNFEGKKTDYPPPEQTIASVIEAEGLPEPAAGMMTAASMNSFQYVSLRTCGLEVVCLLTSGLSNALAAGDPGDFAPRLMYSSPQTSRTGTINIAAGINIPLSDSALAEALMIITEAKSSVIFELDVKSIVSERTATGTGTDSAIVFCPAHDEGAGPSEKFCGKHTIAGELFARAIRSALFESLKKDRLFRDSD